MKITIPIRIRLRGIALILVLSTCTPFWVDEYGIQRICFCLTIVNQTSDSVIIEQNPYRDTPRYETTKYYYDTGFVIASLESYVDTIEYEFTALKLEVDGKECFELGTSKTVVEDKTFILNTFFTDTSLSYLIFPWDTSKGDWYAPWNEVVRTFDTLSIGL